MSCDETPVVAPTARQAVLPGPVLDLIEGGVCLMVATPDPSLRPQIARAWGLEALGATGPLRLCVEAKGRPRILDLLVPSAPIAVAFTRPSTYSSVQIKGVVEAVEEPNEEQRHRVADHWRTFATEVELVGLSPHLVGRLVDSEALLSVTVEVKELYDQTPGRRAGVRL